MTTFWRFSNDSSFDIIYKTAKFWVFPFRSSLSVVMTPMLAQPLPTVLISVLLLFLSTGFTPFLSYPLPAYLPRSFVAHFYSFHHELQTIKVILTTCYLFVSLPSSLYVSLAAFTGQLQFSGFRRVHWHKGVGWHQSGDSPVAEVTNNIGGSTFIAWLLRKEMPLL